MITRNRGLLVAAWLMLCLAQCAKERTSLYPLTEGYKWEYEVSVKATPMTIASQMTITNMPVRQLGEISVTPRQAVSSVSMLGESISETEFQFVASGNEGYYLAARQSTSDTQPVPISPPQYILRFPVEVGTTWDYDTRTNLLKASPGAEEFLPIHISSHIESITETVTVPAGTFTDCVRVVGVGSGSAKMGLFFLATSEYSVEQNDWYCPGVGWVKGVASEKSNHIQVEGGTISIQLKTFLKE